MEFPDHPEHPRQLREYLNMPAPIDPMLLDQVATDLSNSLPIKRIATTRGVSEATVRNIASAISNVDRTGIRDRVLAYIVNQGPLDNHRDISEIDTGAGYHESVHVCFRLRRQGLITFRDVRKGNITVLRDIRATARGRATVYTPTPTDDVKIVMPKEGPRTMSDSANLPTRDMLPGGFPSHPPLRAHEPTRVYGVRDDGRHELEGELLAGAPGLQSLMDRDRTVAPMRQAAKLLEQAGHDELAIKVLEEAKDLTPVELEMVAFIKTAIVHRAQEG